MKYLSNTVVFGITVAFVSSYWLIGGFSILDNPIPYIVDLGLSYILMRMLRYCLQQFLATF